MNIAQHKRGYGPYQIHSYYTLSNGQTVGVTSTSTELEVKRAKIQSATAENNQQTFTISNVDPGFSKVQLAVWSTSNGQDDMIWYNATKLENGSYQVSVPLKNHNFEKGNYIAHAYGAHSNQQSYLGESRFSVNQIGELQPSTVNVLSVDSFKGALNIAVTEPENSKKIKQINVAAWSSGDQKNLSWYSVNPSGQTTTIPVNVNRHYYQTGTYTVHTYITYADGTTSGFDLGKHFLQGIDNNLSKVLLLAGSMAGVRGGDAGHTQLVDDYNKVLPRPVGYKATYNDDWCDIFVTTIFQRAGLSVLIGRECGVERHIQIFKTLGIWMEDGTITPQAGDIITFNWKTLKQPNDGFADHIGIVEYVEGGYIYTIEGNGNNAVVRRKYKIGHGNIRGFARPRY